jgi:hypothetical protein
MPQVTRALKIEILIAIYIDETSRCDMRFMPLFRSSVWDQNGVYWMDASILSFFTFRVLQIRFLLHPTTAAFVC